MTIFPKRIIIRCTLSALNIAGILLNHCFRFFWIAVRSSSCVKLFIMSAISWHKQPPVFCIVKIKWWVTVTIVWPKRPKTCIVEVKAYKYGAKRLLYMPQGRCSSFGDTLHCLFSPRAYCWQSRKYEAYALCADASADFITAALAIVAVICTPPLRVNIIRRLEIYFHLIYQSRDSRIILQWR